MDGRDPLLVHQADGPRTAQRSIYWTSRSARRREEGAGWHDLAVLADHPRSNSNWETSSVRGRKSAGPAGRTRPRRAPRGSVRPTPFGRASRWPRLLASAHSTRSRPASLAAYIATSAVTSTSGRRPALPEVDHADAGGHRTVRPSRRSRGARTPCSSSLATDARLASASGSRITANSSPPRRADACRCFAPACAGRRSR